MGSTRVLSAERMLEIEGASVVSGSVNPAGELVLRTKSGALINAGIVKGPQGDPAPIQTSIPTQALSKALLPVGYRGGGPTPVKINGVLGSTPLKWLSGYSPFESREVRLMRFGTEDYISGQINDGVHVLNLQTPFRVFTTMANYISNGTLARAVKLSSGLVVLSGMITTNGVSTDSSNVIATLPPGFRPDTDMIMPVDSNVGARGIEIKADGRIMVRNPVTAYNHISLSGVAFWSAGVAQWTPITNWGANFGVNPSGWDNYGVPSYWKDPYGFVWFRGLVRVNVATTTDNTPMFTLPLTHRADKEQHYRIVATDTYSGLGARPGDGINWKQNSRGAVGNWISLAGFAVLTTDALNTNPWVDIVNFANNWVNLNVTNYPPAGYLMREDGLNMLKGLIRNGNIGARAFLLSDKELWPSDGKAILSVISDNAHARLDIGNIFEPFANNAGLEPGAVMPYSGTNTWFGIDQSMWVS